MLKLISKNKKASQVRAFAQLVNWETSQPASSQEGISNSKYSPQLIIFS